MRKIVGTLAVLYFLVCAGLFVFQRDMLYPGAHHKAYHPPQHVNLADDFQEYEVKTADGLKLTGWRAKGNGMRPTIVFMHGNADTLASSAAVGHIYIARGYNFVVVSYRGYDGQQGAPSEDGLYEDARAAVKFLIAEGTDPHDLIFMGHSLGTGVATQMAVEFPKARAVVLLAPFTSAVDAAKAHYPYVPVAWLMKDRFDNAAKIVQTPVPVFIAHGEDDRTIPFAQGEALSALVSGPKSFLRLPGVGHNDLFDATATPLLTWLDSFQ